jgi:hypothetical protein
VISPQAVDLAPVQAAALIREELSQAGRALQNGSLDAALDRYTCALGLGLQLGPAPTQKVLAAILSTARALAREQNAPGLSALGPTLVDLVAQVRETEVLPATATMDAWAVIAADLGALIGQIGVALNIAPDHRGDMINSARTQAALLDNATNGLFALTTWIDDLRADEEAATRP